MKTQLLLTAFLLFFGSSLSNPSAAALTSKSKITEQQLTACRPGAKLFYVNGVNKINPQGVADSAAELGAYITHFGVTCVSDVSYLYNPSNGLMFDVFVEADRKSVV